MKKAKLYYDGECPFCNSYAKLQEIRSCLVLELCDAREDFSYTNAGENLKLDDGVILLLESGEVYQGVAAIRKLHTLCSFKSFFYKIQRWIFSTKSLSYGVYALLKALRYVALRIKRHL